MDELVLKTQEEVDELGEGFDSLPLFESDKVIAVDNESYDFLSQFRWFLDKDNKIKTFLILLKEEGENGNPPLALGLYTEMYLDIEEYMKGLNVDYKPFRSSRVLIHKYVNRG